MTDLQNIPRSTWQEEAQFRADNRTWLRRSQAIAIAVLRRIRELDINQKELANLMLVSPQQINKWVKGSENFRFDTISKLEEALQMELMHITGTPVKREQINLKVVAEPVSPYKADDVITTSDPEYKCVPLYGKSIYTDEEKPLLKAI